MLKLKSKNGNESSIIVVILAILLVVVLAIVGVIVAKDNKGLATFDGGKVTKAEYKIYYQMFSSYLQMYGYSSSEIPEQILYKAAQDKMILTDAKIYVFVTARQHIYQRKPHCFWIFRVKHTVESI